MQANDTHPPLPNSHHVDPTRHLYHSFIQLCNHKLNLTLTLTHTTGFIQLCNRKGTIKVQYTLDVELTFQREMAGETNCTGKIKMPEVFDDEPEADVVIDKKSKGGKAEPDRALKQKLCEKAVEMVAAMIAGMKDVAPELMSPTHNK